MCEEIVDFNDNGLEELKESVLYSIFKRYKLYYVYNIDECRLCFIVSCQTKFSVSRIKTVLGVGDVEWLTVS